MKQVAILFFFLLNLALCYGQVDSSDNSAVIKKQVETMGQYLLKHDFNSFCAFTYPETVKMLGGKQNMIALMEKGIHEMNADGIDFLNFTFGEPSTVINVGDELQCTISQTIILKVPDGKLASQSTLIAISIDGGKYWYFVDTAGKDIQTMKKVLPNLSDKLILPPQMQPVFYSN